MRQSYFWRRREPAPPQERTRRYDGAQTEMPSAHGTWYRFKTTASTHALRLEARSKNRVPKRQSNVRKESVDVLRAAISFFVEPYIRFLLAAEHYTP